MEEKRRSKRAKPVDEGSWECSVCTYKNSPEAFKCDMCDVRKGTSTRKPRINPQLVAQQVAQQYTAPPAKKEKGFVKKDKNYGCSSTGSLLKGDLSYNHKKQRPPRLKNIDRTSGTSMEVTVGNVTVVITDYKPKKEKTAPVATPDSHNSSSTQSDSAESSISTSNSELANGDELYAFKDDS